MVLLVSGMVGDECMVWMMVSTLVDVEFAIGVDGDVCSMCGLGCVAVIVACVSRRGCVMLCELR